MVSKTVLFNCEKVLPMKAVAVLIQKASAYRSGVWISRGQRKANAKSLLGVMSLGIDGTMTLQVSADGSDEILAMDDVCCYLENPGI